MAHAMHSAQLENISSKEKHAHGSRMAELFPRKLQNVGSEPSLMCPSLGTGDALCGQGGAHLAWPVGQLSPYQQEGRLPSMEPPLIHESPTPTKCP
jgi:hypothetical protein